MQVEGEISIYGQGINGGNKAWQKGDYKLFIF